MTQRENEIAATAPMITGTVAVFIPMFSRFQSQDLCT